MKNIFYIALSTSMLGLLILPILSNLIIGKVPLFEGEVVQMPTMSEVFESSEVRSNLSKAIFKESPLRKAVLSKLGTFTFENNATSTSAMISGLDSWLFYKDQFFQYDCFFDDKIRENVFKQATIAEYLKASGMEVYFTFAPNKASLYPEFIDEPFKSSYYPCYKKNSEFIRNYFEGYFPEYFLFHYSSVNEIKNRGILAFIKTDTHWTDVSAISSFAKLVSFIGVPSRIDNYIIPQNVEKYPHKSDLGNSMLLADIKDYDYRLKTNIKKGLFKKLRSEFKNYHKKISVVHDSFYDSIVSFFRLSGVAVKDFHHSNTLRQSPKALKEELKNSDVIIFSTVARSFPLQIIENKWDWNGILAQIAREKGERLFSSCEFDSNSSIKEPSKNKDYYAVSSAFLTSQTPCIGIDFDSDSEGMLKVELPFKLKGDSFYFNKRRIVEFPIQKGKNKIRSMLPSSSIGALRINNFEGIEGMKVTIGEFKKSL